MPKHRRSQTVHHKPSAKLNARPFVASKDVEHVEIGAAQDSAVDQFLSSGLHDSDEKPAIKKKDKRTLKRQQLMGRLEASQPYSKLAPESRRRKSKSKEELVTGLGDVRLALDSVISGDQGDEPTKTNGHRTPKVGKGKSHPLSQGQRNKALSLERLRQSVILKTPEFVKNPFQAIRTHTENTLEKREMVLQEKEKAVGK